MSFTVYLALGTIASYVLWQFFLALKDPLRDVPGPAIARVTRFWYWYRAWRGEWNWDVVELHRKYGSKIVRYAPGQYSISDPDAIKPIHGYGADFDKAPIYVAWNPPGFKGLFNEPKSDAHAAIRKKYTSMYAMSSVSQYEQYVDECLDIFCKRLEGHEGKQIDLLWELHCFAIDAVGLLTFGKRFGYLDNAEDIGNIAKNVLAVAKYATLMGIVHELHKPYYWLMGVWAGLTQRSGTAKLYLNKFALETIKQRKQERSSDFKKGDDGVGPVSMLDKFLDANDNDPQQFTMHHVMVGLAGNIVAGSDTTSATMTAAMYYLTKNRTAMSELRSQMDVRASNDFVTLRDIQGSDLAFTQAVVTEALRLWPQTGLGLPRTIPPTGATILGQYFPPETVVTMSSWASHYGPDNFEDPYSFKPERWLTADKEAKDRMNRAYFPFGLGSRNCIGKNVAMLVMQKAVPELAKRFDFELAGKLGEGEELQASDYFVIRPVEMPVVVRKRVV